MLILISPAKTLDFATPATGDRFSEPAFLAETKTLVEQLQKLSAQEISDLMKISDKLGQLNASRYQTWQEDFDTTNAKQALLAFRGDVYQGMDVDRFEPQEFDFAQEHLLILSGLYGMLRPLDLMQPYRLEMGTKLAHAKLQDLAVDNLYEFWGDKLTEAINRQLGKLGTETIVNLASNEYFKAVILITTHHSIALYGYTHSWSVVWLGSLGVFLAGIVWAWCYSHYQSVIPGYISHVLADLAIAIIGYQLLFV